MNRQSKPRLDVDLVFDLKVFGHRIASGKLKLKSSFNNEPLPPQQPPTSQEA